MPKLTSVKVALNIPYLGGVEGTWEPDETEQRAAWDMYVELVTRISVVELRPGEGGVNPKDRTVKEVNFSQRW
jgi:hypothetical protein